MREKGLKRTSVLFALLFALTALFAGSALLFTRKVYASADPTARALYFVDAGYMTKNENGTGELGNHGESGYICKESTPFMEKYGLAYGKSASDATGLYNSVTDKPLFTMNDKTPDISGGYEADEKTGKHWGFNLYDADGNASGQNYEWFYWRYGQTGSEKPGFETYRRTQNGNNQDNLALVYKFEVDDNTTPLKLTFGTRMKNGWDNATFDVRVNRNDSLKLSDVTAKTNEEKDWSITDITGVAENGSNYVSVEFGSTTQECMITYILLTTADYELQEAAYTLPTFVKKGDTQITLKGSTDNQTVALSQDAQDKIAAADDFGQTKISAEYDGSEYSKSVTVLPASTRYFINLPNTEQDGTASPDAEYSAESKCGYVGAAMTVKSNGATYADTGRYGANDTSTTYTYRFDMDDAGSYGVRVGTYGWWSDRKLGVKVNGGNETVVDTKKDKANVALAYGDTLEDEGKNKLELTIRSAQNDGACVTYILVFAAKKITYNSNGGSAVSPVYFESGATQTVTEPTDPTRTGYRFDGWYEDEDLQTPYSFEDAETTDDFTLYASWTEMFGVTFNTHGGSSVASTTAASGEKVTKPADPTRTGYTFGKWYKEAEYTNEWDFDADTVTAATELHASWTANQYTITWNFNGAEGENPTTQVTYGEAFSLPATNPTRTGYEFSNWYTAAAGGTQVTAGTWTTADNATYYAHWTANTYTITWDLNNGGGSNPTTPVTYDAAFTLPTPPARTGYEFSNWYTAAAGGTQVTAGTWTTADNATYYAHWELKQYTISWNANGGSFADTPSDTTVSYGGALALPTAPTRTGYTFAGWNTAADGTGTTVAAGTVTLDVTAGAVTLYAKWTANTYAITYELNGGTNANGAPANYVYGVGVPTLPTPTKAGYRFDGWYDNAALSGTAVTAISGTDTDEKALYAKWTQVFTVTFNVGGGSAVNADTVAIGEKATKPTDPTRDGYTFGGWYKDADCTEEWNFAEDTVTADVTLYAKWTENTPASSGNGGKKSGCGSSVMAETSAVIAVLMLVLAGVVVIKKKSVKN